MNKIPALLGILAVMGCVSLTVSCGRTASRPQDAVRRTQAPAVSAPINNAAGDSPVPEDVPPHKKKGVIYVVSPTGGDDNNLVAQPVTWHPSQSPALDSLNALAQAEHSPLPTGTQLRGVKIADGLATVDFSREFQENFHGGETEEAQTVNSVLRTLGQFPNVERVQILVEGRPIDALSQLIISGPLDVIRPDTVRQARDGGN